jgi:eukaryotic-like serine/threonine-protein kinase
VSETLADGRYHVERELARGGMAIVYLAHDEELRRPVVIKLLAEHLAADRSFHARLLREARLAGRLSHPNVVRVYDAGESDGRPFIVMEYVPGRTLAECGKLPPARSVELALQACAGLQHAHEAGVVHRDVKPGNLLLRHDGVLKVADFGIARAAETTRHTQPGSLLGTAAYLAPEQAAGEEITPAADIYSLGAVLYELLTGLRPYEFGSLVELAAKQASGVITPVRDVEPAVPHALEAAVMHALAQEARFRPASAADFAGELAGAIELPPERLLATAVTEPLASRHFASIPGRGGWFWLAAAAAVAAVALIIGLARIGVGEESVRPSQPPRVVPPAQGRDAEEEARNLARWLRSHSR